MHMPFGTLIGIIPTTWGVRRQSGFVFFPGGIIPTTWGVPAIISHRVAVVRIIPTTWGVLCLFVVHAAAFGDHPHYVGSTCCSR